MILTIKDTTGATPETLALIRIKSATLNTGANVIECASDRAADTLAAFLTDQGTRFSRVREVFAIDLDSTDYEFSTQATAPAVIRSEPAAAWKWEAYLNGEGADTWHGPIYPELVTTRPEDATPEALRAGMDATAERNKVRDETLAAALGTPAPAVRPCILTALAMELAGYTNQDAKACAARSTARALFRSFEGFDDAAAAHFARLAGMPEGITLSRRQVFPPGSKEITPEPAR